MQENFFPQAQAHRCFKGEGGILWCGPLSHSLEILTVEEEAGWC